ncbi:sugar-binding domain-containing protein [Luteimicrobium sp. NPDC057192]|uniref:sugar-binding domain-containing protein n=1 Tax=Luteimicrobium sp. NPDC057192 TaxID=3346042 RepID=UPI003640EAD6
MRHDFPHRRASGRVRWLRASVAGSLAFTAAVALVSTAAAATSGTATASDDGRSGLRADYYTITDTDTFALDPANLKASVVDPDVDVDDMIPTYKAILGQPDEVGVRWSGFVTAPKTGDYTFSAIGDNGFRLWVGGNSSSDELIDFWVNQWDLEQTATRTVHLEAGQPVPFTFEQFQATGGANVHLRWASTDAGIAKEAVPASAFTLPEDFTPYAAAATIPAAGTSVDLTFPGAVTGAEGMAGHVRLAVGDTDYPVTGVTAGPTPSSVRVTLGAQVPRGVAALVTYDGAGGARAAGDAIPAFATRVTNDSTFLITTTWAKDVDPNHPLPEYPRPQLTRTAWQNLNGKWDFTPLAAADTAPPSTWSDAKTAVVPYPTESQLSGIQDHYDHFAYHRTFTVPSSWNVGDKPNQQRLELNFGAVDYQATVYVNGKIVAEHTGGYDAFTADITDAVKKGRNDVVVRVTDTTGEQPIGKQNPHPTGLSYTASSGIWQTVWMEPVQQVHVDSLQLTPQLSSDADGAGDALQVTAAASGASNHASVVVTVYDADGKKAGTASGRANEPLTVPIASSHRWTPDDPYLYTVRATLHDGASKDTVGSYVGLRSIGIKSIDGTNRIVLNGKQTFLLATLDQGFWPDGVYTAPTEEALNWDIQTTKDLGFNTIRKHIKVEPQRWYYDAAKDGVMVWQDMPSSSNRDAAQQDEWKSELRRMIDQHASDTAIIGWIPFNEGWGEWSQDGAADVAASIKAQDPTRLVDTRSGQNCCDMPGDNGSGDIIDWHTYAGPATPTPDATRAAIDGEHGGLSMTVLGHIWSTSNSPYQAFGSKDALTDAYVQNTESLVGLARDRLSGSVYTQFTDIEGETNGFYTYDRAFAKMDDTRVRAVNQAVIAAGSQHSAG